jgi:hypothetical protein
MISYYRLGDLVLLNLDENSKNNILQHHPNSIGSYFINIIRNGTNLSNIDILYNLVQDYIKDHQNLFPKDISESTVIHLRLGDVIGGDQWHEKLKRPLDENYLKSVLENDTNTKYVIGKCFFAVTSSNNYDKSIEMSNNYLRKVLELLNAKHIVSDNADYDLCCGVQAKLFVQGKGYFSKLIVELRKKMNKESIETLCHDPIEQLTY